MKIIRAIFEIILVALVLIFFTFGWIKRIDAENQRTINVDLIEINENLNDSIETLNGRIIQLEKNSQSD